MRKLVAIALVTGCGGHTSGGSIPDTAPADSACVPEVCGDGVDNDCNGQVDDGCNGLGTWVSGTVGDDANPGTQAAPVKTIAKGIANAMTIGGGQAVYVGQGHYPEKVTLVEGISLLGGYECMAQPCAWTWDPVKNDTAILDQDLEGVLVPATITRSTRLDGFRVMGFSGQSATTLGAAVSVKGAPTITHDRIFGGTIGGTPLSAGIAVLAPTSGAALIQSNDITVGMSNGNAAGIAFTATMFPVQGPAVAEVRSNTIHGGMATTVAGIGGGTSGAGTLVAGNDIVAGQSMPNGARGGAWAIQIGGAMTIDSNHINVPPAKTGGCAATDWCGGIESLSATATITNNVIYGATTARSTAVRLREVEVAAGAVVLNSNYLDGNGGVAGSAQSVSAAVQLEYTGCGNCGTNAVMGKIRNNILGGGANAQRVGILENDTTNARTNRPQALDNNDFWFGTSVGVGDVLWHRWNGTTGVNLTTIVQVNLQMNPTAVANLNADPQLDATWHLTNTSPCVDTATATESPTTDMDGGARPDGKAPDIGPDEM